MPGLLMIGVIVKILLVGGPLLFLATIPVVFLEEGVKKHETAYG